MQEGKRHTGVVFSFDPIKRFGFIERSGGRRIHFHVNAVCRDWRGSCSHATTVGATVSFLKEVDQTGRPTAINVLGDFVEPQTESLDTYSEVSLVVAWDGLFGKLERPTGGDHLFLHRDAIISNHDVGIEVGDFLFHGVRVRGEDRRGNPKWVADRVELYSDEEQARMQQGLPAYEVETQTEEVPKILA